MISLVEIEQEPVKSGTISISERAYPINVMTLSVVLVLWMAVEATIASDLPKLVDGINRLATSDSCAQVSHEDRETTSRRQFQDRLQCFRGGLSDYPNHLIPGRLISRNRH
jgi:translation elongation factor EF-G